MSFDDNEEPLPEIRLAGVRRGSLSRAPRTADAIVKTESETEGGGDAGSAPSQSTSVKRRRTPTPSSTKGTPAKRGRNQEPPPEKLKGMFRGEEEMGTADPGEGIENPDELVAGVDEAGRGCCLGTMFVCLVVASRAQEVELRSMGVKDSKAYVSKGAKALRTNLARHIRESVPFCVVKSATAEEISARPGELTKISAELFLACARAIPDDLMPSELVIDAFTDPGAIAEMFEPWTLEVRARGLEPPVIAPKHKADALHPAVSAASVVAKECREGWVAEAKEKLSEGGYDDLEFGSGYQDPKTVKWLEDYYLRHGRRFPKIARTWWGTCRNLVLKHGGGGGMSAPAGSSAAAGRSGATPNLRFVRGDAFRTPFETLPLLVPCNATSKSAKGFVWDVYQRHKEADVYALRSHERPEDELGTVKVRLPLPSEENGRILISAFCQKFQGSASGGTDTAENRRRWFAECLEASAKALEGLGKKEFCLPSKYGFDSVGNDWGNYEAKLVEFAARHRGLTVYVIERSA